VKPAPPHRPLRPAALALVLLAGAAPVAPAQQSPTAGWSGSVVAQVNVTTDTYSRNETQTWTLTGAPPTMAGSIAVYPAKWSYSGSGTYQSSGYGTTTNWTWTINTPPIDVPIAVAVRSSDNKLTFHRWSAALSTYGANWLTAKQTVTAGGQTTTHTFGFFTNEWNFDWIVDDSSKSDISGSTTLNVGRLPGPATLSALMPPENATFTWHFTNGPAAAPLNLTATPLTPGVVSLTIPNLTSVSPAVVGQAAGNYGVVLTGSATHFADGTSRADFGDGITVTSLSVHSPTSAIAQVKITAATALGPRTVTVTTGSEVVRKVNGFSINQGTVVGPPPPVATSGYYRIILNGFRCNRQTFHDISLNAGPDEVYAAAGVYLCRRNPTDDRTPLTLVSSSLVRTAVHGIIPDPNQVSGVTDFGSSPAPGNVQPRVRAGSATPSGGITNGDVFPTGQNPGTTTANPTPNSFPLLLWQGQLTNGQDAVVIAPVLWKWTTGDASAFSSWSSTRNGFSGDSFLFNNQPSAEVAAALLPGIKGNNLTPVVSPGSEGPLIRWYYIAPVTGGSVFDCWPSKDRPIGLKAPYDGWDTYGQITSGATLAAFGVPPLPGISPDGGFVASFVVVTRESIEAALASQQTYGPGLSPGVVPLHFVDHGVDLDGDYDVFLRVERAPEAAATAPPNVSTTQAAPAVPITSVTPNSGQQWDDQLVVTFEAPGAHFVQDRTTVDLGPGITAVAIAPYKAVDVASPSKTLATLKIAGDAAPGPRTIKITTGSEIATLANGFTVVARDVHDVFQISPASGRVAQQGLAVAISRPSPWPRDYFSTQGTTLDFGPGIAVTGFAAVISDDYLAHAKATLNIAASAPIGPRTVTVKRTGLPDDSFPAAFSVASLIDKSNLATPKVGAAPAITGVSPNSGKAGTSRLVITFTAQSTHFVQDSTKIDLGSGITLADQYLFIVSPTQAMGGFTIDSNAAPGPRTVTITTGNEVVRLANGFTVTP